MSENYPTDSAPASQTAGIRGTPARLRYLRLAVQLLVLCLFLYLLVGTTPQFRTFVQPNLFFLIDPLAGLGAMLAGHVWIVPMVGGGLALLAISLAFGRVWCGWLCPLGSLIDRVPSRHISKPDRDFPTFWRQGKNVTLFLVLIGALLGSLTLIVLDPITLLYRSLAAGILPLLSSGLEMADKWLYGTGIFQSDVAWFDTSVRINLLGDTSFYLPNLTLIVFFLAVLALNAVRPRAWCRYLCPLGGALGLVSRFSLVRHHVDRQKCVSCDRCAIVCHTGAINPGSNYSAAQAECTTCLDCVGVCPTRAISFSRKRLGKIEYQPERRQFLVSLGLSLAAVILLRYTIFSPDKTSPGIVRPPGATEESLRNQCIRCGECIKICPTVAIQPLNSTGAIESTWSPYLQLRHGYCDYSCNACGQVCPTGAIDNLSLNEKRKYIVGMAIIDEKRCIPFAQEKECIVCEEMCPLPKKAVVLKRGEGIAARPYVDRSLCNGCGICEHQCPVQGESAIKIFTSPAAGPFQGSLL